MIIVNSIVGNIHTNPKLRKKYDKMKNKSEAIKITRLECQRVRMRKTSDNGTDVGIDLPSGTKLRHGDVIYMRDDVAFVIQIQAENVAEIEFKERDLSYDEVLRISTMIGHTIGNLHRPIKVERNKIYFPLLADSELDLMRKSFSSILDHLEIRKNRMVFEEEGGFETHTH